MTTSAVEHEISPEAVLEHQTGNQLFAAALSRVTANDLPRFLGRYIQFNSVFGSGVASLAGQIGSRQDLFRDSAEEYAPLADRSSEVAAEIFYAAIDEFGDHTQNRRGTHRTIAQATLRAVSDYFGSGLSELNHEGFINSGTVEAVAGVRAGYGLCGLVTDERILRGIGFHVASETLADCEFRLLDEILRNRFPGLVASLEKSSVTVGNTSVSGYLWIRIHTTAEVEHSDAAFEGIKRAIRYYNGAGGRDRAFKSILEGVGDFASLQQKFMNQLMN